MANRAGQEGTPSSQVHHCASPRTILIQLHDEEASFPYQICLAEGCSRPTDGAASSFDSGYPSVDRKPVTPREGGRAEQKTPWLLLTPPIVNTEGTRHGEGSCPVSSLRSLPHPCPVLRMCRMVSFWPDSLISSMPSTY